MRPILLLAILAISSAIAFAQKDEAPLIQHFIPDVGYISLPPQFLLQQDTPTLSPEQTDKPEDALRRIRIEKRNTALFVMPTTASRTRSRGSTPISYIVEATEVRDTIFQRANFADTSRAAMTAYEGACRRLLAQRLPRKQVQIESWIAPRAIGPNTLTYECQYRIGTSELHTMIALLCVDSEKLYHAVLTGASKNIKESRELLVKGLHSFTPLTSGKHLLLEPESQPEP